jgi:hypothetical protein
MKSEAAGDLKQKGAAANESDTYHRLREVETKRVLRKTPLLFEIFLCLSRACLDKIIVFMYKWRKKWRLSYRSPLALVLRRSHPRTGHARCLHNRAPCDIENLETQLVPCPSVDSTTSIHKQFRSL